MKRHRYFDRCLCPTCINIHPFSIALFVLLASPQGNINRSPRCIPHIRRLKTGIADDIKKIFEALLGFLNTVAPIPITKEKRVSVRVWKIIIGIRCGNYVGNCRLCVGEIIQCCQFFWVVYGRFCAVVLAAKSKYITWALEIL